MENNELLIRFALNNNAKILNININFLQAQKRLVNCLRGQDKKALDTWKQYAEIYKKYKIVSYLFSVLQHLEEDLSYFELLEHMLWISRLGGETMDDSLNTVHSLLHNYVIDQG